jgi:hypothetical protein
MDLYCFEKLDNLRLFSFEFDPLLCLTYLKNNNYKFNVDVVKKDKMIENISKDEECSAIYLLDNINDFKNIPKEIIATVSKSNKSITEVWLDRIIEEKMCC